MSLIQKMRILAAKLKEAKALAAAMQRAEAQ
jgi:hypothetical protein